MSRFESKAKITRIDEIIPSDSIRNFKSFSFNIISLYFLIRLLYFCKTFPLLDFKLHLHSKDINVNTEDRFFGDSNQFPRFVVIYIP